MKLVIANKNYSSWSMRPWVLLTHFGVAFEEKMIGLATPETAGEILRFSPSGRLPCLIDGESVVWDSLAICETLAERYPQMWPSDPARRAHARSVSAEMHSGFGGVRSGMPMNVRGRSAHHPLNDEERADLVRLEFLWSDCLKRYGGPFLFGEFSIADAMFAPVVMRFNTYLPPLSAAASAYAAAVSASPAVQAWVAGAQEEGRAIDHYDALL